MRSKANNGKGNVPERDTWQTPQKLWDQLNEQYGFTFDCCASEDNTKCPNGFSDDFETTIEEAFFYHDVSWMNPPFSIAERMFKHFFKVLDGLIGSLASVDCQQTNFCIVPCVISCH